MLRDGHARAASLGAALVLAGTSVAAVSGATSPEPDTLPQLAERLSALASPADQLAEAHAASLAVANRSLATRPGRKLAKCLTAQHAEIERVCDLYRTQGETLFLGQEISAIYRRRLAVERTLANNAPLPAELTPAWEDLLTALVRLHEAVDWSDFNYWYLERDGDSD